MWQPQPRVNAAFYENLSACERAIQERRILGFTYKKSSDGTVLARHSDPTVLDEVTAKGYDAERKLGDTLRHSFGIFSTSGKPRKVVVKVALRRVADVLARRWPAEESG